MDYEAKTEETPFTPEMEAGLRQIVRDRAAAELERLAEAIGDDEAFVHLPRAAAAAFNLEQFDAADHLAQRALALAPRFLNDWNHGNAVHLGHTVLGLLALQTRDHAAALAHLHESGQSPGSPQLNSFGPTMQLAKALLRIGEVEPVLAYLKQCRTFWKLGGTWLDLWERKIRAGDVPNFFQHSHV